MQSIKRIHFDEYSFDIWENVYEPAEDSFLFAENLDVPLGAQVLDVGTGCGLLAVLAAAKNGNVLAVRLKSVSQFVVQSTIQGSIVFRYKIRFFAN